ncbi:MAG: response regulator [Bacteroidota bacterium]
MHILLVEDNHRDARLLMDVLALHDTDHTFTHCKRLIEVQALHEQGAEAPDIILLDLTLPESRGLDTYTEVYGLYNTTPIVVLTGTNDEEVGLEAVQMGAQDYLIKGEADVSLISRVIRYAYERQAQQKVQSAYLQDLYSEKETLKAFILKHPDPHLVVEVDGAVHLANTRAAELLGVDLATLEGGHVTLSSNEVSIVVDGQLLKHACRTVEVDTVEPKRTLVILG